VRERRERRSKERRVLLTPVVCAGVAELDIRDEKHEKRGRCGLGGEGTGTGRGVQATGGLYAIFELRFKKGVWSVTSSSQHLHIRPLIQQRPH
jgi:hypothetical protein